MQFHDAFAPPVSECNEAKSEPPRVRAVESIDRQPGYLFWRFSVFPVDTRMTELGSSSHSTLDCDILRTPLISYGDTFCQVNVSI